MVLRKGKEKGIGNIILHIRNRHRNEPQNTGNPIGSGLMPIKECGIERTNRGYKPDSIQTHMPCLPDRV